MRLREIEGREYNCVYGAIAFPGKNTGYAVIIGSCRREEFEKAEFYLIAEVENCNSRELVRAVSALDLKYTPELWYGDPDDSAGKAFIFELNEELKRKFQMPYVLSKRLRYNTGIIEITKTAIIEMDEPFQYILPILKRLLSKEKQRRLFIPPSSKILKYLSEIKRDDEIATLQFGDYPAIEALAFAVIEMQSNFSRASRATTTTRKQDDESCSYDPMDF